MHILYTEEEYELAKSKDKLAFKCHHCDNKFYVTKRLVKSYRNSWTDIKRKKIIVAFKYCSRKCFYLSQTKSTEEFCKNCNKIVIRLSSEKKKSKSGNCFCSRSCSATYNNRHKTTGNRRSKLEKWIEEQLTILYPNLQISYNSKEIINSELDIYIPSLNLAIEVNGIFHYKPIYGSEKLISIQNNDGKKIQACLDKNIKLVIIDVSSLERFKENYAIKYLQIIQNIISLKAFFKNEA